MELYRDGDPPGVQQMFRCAFLHPKAWLNGARLRCNLAKKHIGPHLFETVPRREYKIWPEASPDFEVEHPEWYF